MAPPSRSLREAHSPIERTVSLHVSPLIDAFAVNRRVSDRCAGHGRVRSRVVVAEEDEVRGGAEEVAVDRIPAVQRDPHQQTVSSFAEREVQGNRQKLSVTVR